MQCVCVSVETGVSVVITHLASRARAMIPAARGADADVPVCESVHFFLRSVVTCARGHKDGEVRCVRTCTYMWFGGRVHQPQAPVKVPDENESEKRKKKPNSLLALR